jgi:hypothetical protein
VIPDITLGEVAFMLVVAPALSGLVGLERERHEGTAGLRVSGRELVESLSLRGEITAVR